MLEPPDLVQQHPKARGGSHPTLFAFRFEEGGLCRFEEGGSRRFAEVRCA